MKQIAHRLLSLARSIHIELSDFGRDRIVSSTLRKCALYARAMNVLNLNKHIAVAGKTAF